MQRKYTLPAILTVVAIAGGAFLIHQKNKTATPPKKEAPLNVEEILKERANQASQHLEQPLGKAIVQKDWAQVDKIYDPEKGFHELAEVIRALFIEGKMKNFSMEEQDRLLGLVILTFNKLDPKSLHLTGLLGTQLERLPAPKHTSPNFKALQSWAKSTETPPILRKMAIKKLVLHDASPDASALELFQKSLIHGTTAGADRSEWITLVDDIRNETAQRNTLEMISKNLRSIPAADQPAALILLSRHLEVNPAATKRLALQFIESDDLGRFESALRSMKSLIAAKQFDAQEKTVIVKRLTNMPSSVHTPFVYIRSKEVLKLLQ